MVYPSVGKLVYGYTLWRIFQKCIYINQLDLVFQGFCIQQKLGLSTVLPKVFNVDSNAI